MGIIGKLFGRGSGNGSGDSKSHASAFSESQVAGIPADAKSQNSQRRDLVRLVLRETMRRHGIPSDWLDCRTLSVVSRQNKSGMHMQILVRQGDHQLLEWVHAFQETFWEQVRRMDPKARDWLLSVGWEFYGKSQQGYEVLPGAGKWLSGGTAHKEAGDTLPPELVDEQEALATDLQALQALVSTPAGLGHAAEETKGSGRGAAA